MNSTEFADEWRAYVGAAAAGAARGSSVVEADDVEMEVWTELLARFDQVSEMEPHNVKWFISRAANTAVARERRDYEYFRGNFVYTTEYVRKILEEAVWADLDAEVDLDARVDVESAFKRLSLRAQRLLFKRFGLGEEVTATERTATNRYVTKIASWLNDNVSLEEVAMDTL